MLEIQEMTEEDAREVFARMGYGHLACCQNDQPYVVPVHYAYDGENAFVYTTEGRKAEILRANPEVCLQAEDVEDNENWTSVMAFGKADQLVDENDRQSALDLLLKLNPRLTPAVSIRWMDSWVRENIEVIYRIRPQLITGRQTIKRKRKNDAMLGRSRKSELN